MPFNEMGSTKGLLSRRQESFSYVKFEGPGRYANGVICGHLLNTSMCQALVSSGGNSCTGTCLEIMPISLPEGTQHLVRRKCLNFHIV